MSISQDQIVRKLLLKTYFLLIRSQLICLTLFRTVLVLDSTYKINFY